MSGAVRALEVLTHLSGSGRPVPAGVIARECGIPRSSTYGILNDLATAGFAERTGDGFKAGPRAHALSGGVTIAGALAVLECFDHAATHLNRADLCRRAGMPLDRLTPLVDDLLGAGLLVAAEGRLALGVRVTALAARSGPLHRLRVAARPVLTGLRDTTGETANLVVRDGDELVYLDQVESPHALRHAGWVGRRLPLAEGAASAALADADGSADVRVAQDAVEVGVTAVACRLRAAHPPAAVGVTAPSARMGRRRLAACRAAVAGAAYELDAALAAGSDDREDDR
ncbi:MAG TPA: helix-turn-helix domain-containing protein [Solirubrobacteraceae bacterium]|nr:helix-turn-helix domain-containing protein [Solirubrobacteraceae bacterium]